VERNRATLSIFSAKEITTPGGKGKPAKTVMGPAVEIPMWFTLVGSTIGYYAVKHLAAQP
jgi:hypothetical protein